MAKIQLNGKKVVIKSNFSLLDLLKKLRNKNICCDMSYKRKAKVLDQFQYAEDNNIPYCIILGEDEISKKIYKVRNTKTREEKEIPFDKILDEIIL